MTLTETLIILSKIVEEKGAEWIASRIGITSMTIKNWIKGTGKPNFAERAFIRKMYNQVGK